MKRFLFDVAVERKVVPAHSAGVFARFRRAHDAYAALDGHQNHNAMLARDPEARLYEKLIGGIDPVRWLLLTSHGSIGKSGLRPAMLLSSRPSTKS